MIANNRTRRAANLAAWGHVMATGFLIDHGDPENQRRSATVRSIAEKARRTSDPRSIARIAYVVAATAHAFDDSANHSTEELARMTTDQTEMNL